GLYRRNQVRCEGPSPMGLVLRDPLARQSVERIVMDIGKALSVQQRLGHILRRLARDVDILVEADGRDLRRRLGGGGCLAKPDGGNATEPCDAGECDVMSPASSIRSA